MRRHNSGTVIKCTLDFDFLHVKRLKFFAVEDRNIIKSWRRYRRRHSNTSSLHAKARRPGVKTSTSAKYRPVSKMFERNLSKGMAQFLWNSVSVLTIHSGVIAEKPAAELFTLDTTGSEAIKQDYTTKHKPLRAEEIIAARDTKLPALESRKRKSGDGIVEPSSKRSKDSTYVSHKDLQRLKSRAFGGEHRQKNVVVTSQAGHDPWAMEAPVQDPRFSFLEQKQPKREPPTLRHAPVSLAASGKPFAAVRKPDAGKSYNPDFAEWENLIAKEGEKEVEAEKKRLKDAQEEAERMDKALAEAARPDPVSDEEYESAWESEWEGIQSEPEESALTKKRPERKTPAERNKVKKRKEAERQAKWDAQMKKREEQQKRIKQIAKEVEKKQRERAAQAHIAPDSTDESGEEEELRRRKFGKLQYVGNFTPRCHCTDATAEYQKRPWNLYLQTSFKTRYELSDRRAICSRNVSAISWSTAR